MINPHSKIPMDQCIKGRLYRISSRNLSFGVYDGNEGFIGIRHKFGDRYLFTEYHWDQGPPFGTVNPQEDTGIDIPEGVTLARSLGTKDEVTGRLVDFDQPIDKGGKGWYFLDTGEASKDIRGYSIWNMGLFDFLDTFEEEGDLRGRK